jgi:hypothetical protein
MREIYFKSEKEKRRFLKDWHSSRPLDEKIRRVQKFSSYLDSSVLEEIVLKEHSSLNPDIINIDIKLKESLSFEDRIIIASVKGLKITLNKDISFKDKIKEVEYTLNRFNFKHQRKKLINEINMQFNGREKRIVNYVLRKKFNE